MQGPLHERGGVAHQTDHGQTGEQSARDRCEELRLCEKARVEQRASSGQLDCGECHRPDIWNVVRFDHDRTEFPLRGRHFVTDCYECHTAEVWSGVRKECLFCHRGDRARADAKHPDHVGNSLGCGDTGCHKPFSWEFH